MRNSLSVAVNTAVALIVLVLGGMLGSVFVLQQSRLMKEDLNRRVAFISETLAHEISAAAARGNPEEIGSILTAAALDPEVAYVIIKSSTGAVEAARWEEQPGGKIVEQVFPLPANPGDKRSFGSITAARRAPTAGTINLGISLAQLHARQLKAALQTAMAVAAAALATLLLGGLAVRRLLRRAIDPLLAGIREFGNGNLSSSIATVRDDEIGGISQAFNEMAAHLSETLMTKAELEAAVEERTAALQAALNEQIRAQQALKEREEEVRLLLDSTAEAIFGLDNGGTCTFCNPASLRLLGYETPADLVGKNIHRLIHYKKEDGTPIPDHECQIYRALSSPEKTHSPHTVYWKADGTPLHVECWSNPTMDGDRVTGAVVTFLDISERMRLERQLLQSQKLEAIGLMAGGIAHDFNNLLTPIVGYAEVARRQLGDEHPADKCLAAIVKSANRAADFTRQILAFSRKQVLEMKVINLNEEILAGDKMLRRLIGEDVEVKLSLSADVIAIRADRAQLHQILLNLAVNARDAMPEGGTMSIETSATTIDADGPWFDGALAAGRYALLQVTDNGTGMDEETRRHIFDPFFTTKEVDKGTGLGLSTVHGIVKQHGGEIAVYSEVGIGTTFKIYLPLAAETAEEQEPEEVDEKPAAGSGRILLVEDEEMVREFVVAALAESGYSVHACPSPAEALASVAEGNFDLLVSDVIMPQMNGRELYRKINMMLPDLKVLYITGYPGRGGSLKDLFDGNEPLLQKPFTATALIRKIREVMAAEQ